MSSLSELDSAFQEILGKPVAVNPSLGHDGYPPSRVSQRIAGGRGFERTGSELSLNQSVMPGFGCVILSTQYGWVTLLT